MINPPTSRQDVIDQLTQEGNDLKVTVNTAEQNIEAWFPGERFKFGLAHWLLNSAGYILENACGVPEGKFGAGGSGKPPW